MGSSLRASVCMWLLITILTGGVYPAMVSVIAQFCFPYQANGSLLQDSDRVIGSDLIGQLFSSSKFFWGRPSATSLRTYEASASSGSNLGPLHPALALSVEERVKRWRAEGVEGSIPVDLVTSSASGLDPHISWAAADIQVARVAKARQLSEATVKDLVVRNREGRLAGLWGEPRVNVLRLNRALEALGEQKQ